MVVTGVPHDRPRAIVAAAGEWVHTPGVRSRSARYVGRMNHTALEIIALLLGVAVWWLGIRKIELSTAAKSVASVLEFSLLIAAVVALGWLGLGLFVAASIIGFLGHAVWLAMQQEAILVQVAVRTGADKTDVEALHKRLGRHERLKWVGPIERARWLREIANRGRSLEDIESIAPVIGGLSAIYGNPDAAWLIERFDRLLRLYGEPASRAEEVASTVHGSVNASAATFPEMLDAMIAVADPPA
jgi:hypothetical protein